jgi:hypothetical protein
VLVGGSAAGAADEHAAINQVAITAMSRPIQQRPVLLANLNRSTGLRAAARHVDGARTWARVRTDEP